ncbi:MAG: TonB-dependent receptor [Sphingomonas sp. 28-66-16]|nr:MAG: TonB-dependent receptor [Sphingomonas sp. 28-66-16]
MAGTAIVFLFQAHAALAQEAKRAPADPAAAQTASEGDIIVTAQKREQNILQVPVAVSVINPDTIKAAQVTDFSDVTRVSPSLTISEGGTSASAVVSLRGIGTSSFSTSAEPAVSIIVDDIALLQQGQAFGKLNDIARIEVLRGPQGSLFGKNASAGVINIVTNNPSRDLSGYVEGTLTDDDEAKVIAMLSGPLGADAGFRINAFYADRKGYINNLTNNTRLNGEESYGVRGKFTFSSGPVNVALTADYSKTRSNGNATTYAVLAPTTRQNGAPIDLTGINVGIGNNAVRFNVDNVGNSDQLLLAAKIDIDVGFATLTSTSSYQDWKLDTLTDNDFSPANTINQGGPYRTKQFTQELRLTSPSSGKFNYLVGLYYADGSTDRTFTRTVPGFLAFLRQNWDSTASTKTYAAFAQLGYDFSPSTTLTLGGRVNHEKVGVFFSDNRFAPPVVYRGSASDTAVTGKASLQQFLAKNLTVYASIATGYKGQAYDISSGFNQSRIDNLVKPEHSVAYEVGMKGRFWDNKGFFSLTGFWTDYNNFQSQSAEFIAGAPQFVLRNVGRLRTKGIEFEGSVRPVEGLSLFGSAAYIDAKIRSFPGAACFPNQTVAQGCTALAGTTTLVQNLAGADLANSPKFKFNLGGLFEKPIGGTPMSAFLTANYTWQDKVNFSLDTNPATVQAAYGIANLSVGLRQTERRNWEVSLFVNNLFDKAYAASLIDFTGNGYSSTAIIQQVPRNFRRYIGVRLHWGFGGR